MHRENFTETSTNDSIGIFDEFIDSESCLLGPSRNAEMGEIHLPLATTLEDLSIPKSFKALRCTRDFQLLLRGLQGPLSIIGSGERDMIGKGAQFTVYEAHVFSPPIIGRVPYTIGEVVAVKTPNIALLDGEMFDMSTSKAREVLHDIHLEILVLSHPKLRRHRTIVTLLGWSLDNDQLRYMSLPLLIMECAMCDLGGFFTMKNQMTNGSASEWDIKHHICLDIVDAMCAIHREGIVQGDLKPANVLIFDNLKYDPKVPVIAKLSDFGFCIRHGHERIRPIAWTPAWSSPEFHAYAQTGVPHDGFTFQEFCRAEAYSQGLVIWGVMCGMGYNSPLDMVSDRDHGTTSADKAVVMISTITEMPESLMNTVCAAVRVLLADRNQDRPDDFEVEGLLRNDSDTYKTWYKLHQVTNNPPYI